MKLLLTSAGITNKSIADKLQQLVGKPFAETSVLFIPTAANFEFGDKSWLVKNINELHDLKLKSFDMIDIAGLPETLWLPQLQAADVICFGGGDNAYLARILREQGMKEKLEQLMDESKVYMGISSGSMVAGTALPKGMDQELFAEGNFESDDCEGLSLCDFSFIPHLNSAYFLNIKTEVLDSIKDRLTNTTYAPDDQTAIAVVDGELEIVGGGGIWRVIK